MSSAFWGSAAPGYGFTECLHEQVIAIGRSNWLFAGSLRAGQRAAAVMSLLQSARLNGQDPYSYIKDVLTRVPTQPAGRIEELLPHRWQPGASR